MSRMVLRQMVSSSFTCLVPGLGWLEHLEVFMGAVEGSISVRWLLHTTSLGVLTAWWPQDSQNSYMAAGLTASVARGPKLHNFSSVTGCA